MNLTASLRVQETLHPTSWIAFPVELG